MIHPAGKDSDINTIYTYKPSFELPVGASSRGVLVIDTDHRISSTDGSIFELLGVSSEELIGRNIEDAAKNVLKSRFVEADDYEASWKWLIDHPNAVLDEVLHPKEPENRVMHRYSTPVMGEAGNQVGRIEIYSDITKRRELEATVRSAYEELKVAQDQLVQSEKLRAVGEMASGVAHDFNNTLGIIIGNIQLLLRNTNDKNARTRLQAAERAALDAADTVRRIKEFTQESRNEPFKAIDLSIMSSEVFEMMRPAWQNELTAGINIIFNPADGVYTFGSETEIREVLINIILNAIQAMPKGGTISITTGSSYNTGWVRIADTGTGMSEDVRKRVFDPFFTTREVEGTGLGMSVAYGIIKRHNGSITIESKPGNGTIVTIHLPRAAKMPEPQVDDEPVEIKSITPVNILVVDDEELFTEVLVEMLSECGHAVCRATSGIEAIEKFKETSFDLVFTDLGMPEMSGWQVAKSIKDIEPQTPVVLLTGRGMILNKEELDSSQIDMVLSKPVGLEDLSSAVTEILNQRKAGNTD